MSSYLDFIPNFANQGTAPTLLSGDEGKRTVELGLLARFLAAIDDSNRLLRGKLQSPPVDSFVESMARIENPALVAVADLLEGRLPKEVTFDAFPGPGPD